MALAGLEQKGGEQGVRCLFPRQREPLMNDKHKKIGVALYGGIARFAGGKFIAEAEVELPANATLGDLFAELGLPQDEIGIVFVDAVLHNLPGIMVCADDPLSDGAHVGIFAVDRVWPYQYRDGARMSESLRKAVADGGYLRHRPGQ